MLTRCRRSMVSTYRDSQYSYLVDFSDYNVMTKLSQWADLVTVL